MNQRVNDLSQEALKLTPEERVGLVDAIIASIQPVPVGIASAWTAEVRARIEAYERGEYELEDADDVIAGALAVIWR